jgi:O-antigen/teichoic acid export membrane protein
VNRSRWLTALSLIFFQVLGLLIPLLTLPLLSTALGVRGFGQVMLAQAVVLLAVMWVDSGFNVQSQQAAARDLAAELLRPQSLLDNLMTRSLAAFKAIGVLLLVPLAVPAISYSLLIASLPLVLGTLLFPQWWLLATGRGFSMGLVTVLGRLASAFLVWWLVQSEQDVLTAALAISAGSLLSGLLLIPVWLIPIYRQRHHLSWVRWREYLRLIQPTLLPAFFANACAQLSVVALGTFAGVLQTGLFSAADRLTRAGGHLLSLAEQTCVTQWLQPIASHVDLVQKMRQRLIIFVPLVLSCAILLAWYLAPWVVQLLYGDRFEAAVVILRVLLLWLWLQTVRRFLVAMYWLVDRHIKAQARIQWVEVSLYLGLVLTIALFHRGFGGLEWGVITAYGLCLIETALLGVFYLLNKYQSQPELLGTTRSGDL